MEFIRIVTSAVVSAALVAAVLLGIISLLGRSARSHAPGRIDGQEPKTPSEKAAAGKVA
jgi:hypothetical protein